MLFKQSIRRRLIIVIRFDPHPVANVPRNTPEHNRAPLPTRLHPALEPTLPGERATIAGWLRSHETQLCQLREDGIPWLCIRRRQPADAVPSVGLELEAELGLSAVLGARRSRLGLCRGRR
jgi:hypothetical protein